MADEYIGDTEHEKDLHWAFEAGWEKAMAHYGLKRPHMRHDSGVVDAFWIQLRGDQGVLDDNQVILAVAARRNDAAFMERLARSVEAHRHILDRLDISSASNTTHSNFPYG